MLRINRRVFSSWAGSLPLALAATDLWAQDFPSHAIRIVVPFNAGGPIDIIARSLGARIRPLLGQAIIVDNKGGAATIIGTDNVVKSPPDGYSLLLAGSGGRTILPAVATLPYDPAKDLLPVTRVAAAPQIFVASPQLAGRGISNMKELTAYAKANPGKLNVGSVGAGTITSLVCELYKKENALQMVDVPFRGGAPAVQALLADEVDFLTADVSAVIPLIQSKKIFGLALTGTQRVADLPDVPTVIEAGFPSLVAINVYCLYAPAKTPREVIMKINKAVATALAGPELRSQFEKAGMQASSSTPEELEKFLVQETAKWLPLAKSLGIRLN